MRNRVIGALGALLLSTMGAHAQNLKAAPTVVAADAELKKICGGGDPKGSVYSKDYVPHIIKVMEGNRLTGYVRCGDTDATIHNAELITANPAWLAVGQLDILRQLNGQAIPDQKDKKYAFTVLHQNIGPECLYLVTKEKTYTTFGHVRGNGFDLTVLTGGQKSGSFGTWKILQSVFSDLAEIPVEHIGSADKIVDAVAERQAAFGFFVMRPDPASETFIKIKSKGLNLVPVIDDALSGTYTYLQLKVASGGWVTGKPVFHTTACTSVALITGDPKMVAADNRRVLQRVNATIARMKDVPATDLRPGLVSWKDMWDDMKEVGAEKVADLLESSKRALENARK
ncbi:MAG: hypothetical protein KBE09_01835 [Candidatus Pacebacteria bacterium]|nr:hypothetical protein [Candidatus Paceibacterota bacterium]